MILFQKVSRDHIDNHFVITVYFEWPPLFWGHNASLVATFPPFTVVRSTDNNKYTPYPARRRLMIHKRFINAMKHVNVS